METSPYHNGEIEVHRRLGVERQAAINGRAIATHLIPGALKFIEIQPMVILASSDTEGRPWASAIFGKPGFVKAPDDTHLIIDLSGNPVIPEDPLLTNLRYSRQTGLLLIELSTRRRLRINGTAALYDGKIEITIEQAYPNCPKYIQRRQVTFLPDTSKKLIRSGKVLTDDHWNWILNTDTLFVASMNSQGQMDMSHRGGRPGFVRRTGDHTLQIPDYVGNNMFNTLGNIVDYPKAGLLFIDFEQGRTLQLTGEAGIVWHAEDAGLITGGTNRLWNFSVHSFIELETNKNFSWSFMEYSPFNP
jgi:hypothetical protein